MFGRFLFFQVGFYFPLYYFQLDSVQHGNSETFSFYSVGDFISTWVSVVTKLFHVQLVFLNGTGLIGRLSAGFIAPHVGVIRLMIMSTATCSILILGMVGLNGVPSVVILGTIYGYFAGVCQFFLRVS